MAYVLFAAGLGAQFESLFKWNKFFKNYAALPCKKSNKCLQVTNPLGMFDIIQKYCIIELVTEKMESERGGYL